MGSSCSTLPRTPPKKSDGFFLQYSSSLMPWAQERHLALYAWQQIGGPGCSIIKA